MSSATYPRPLRQPHPGVFAALALAIYGLELLVARSPRAAATPSLIGGAVTVDLVAFVPLLYWLLVVRPSGASPLRVVAACVVGLLGARLILLPEQRHVLLGARVLVLPLELAVMAFVVAQVRRVVRAHRGETDIVDVPERVTRALAGAFPAPAVGAIFATEATMLYYALLAWRRRPHVPPGALAFSYHRRSAVVPTLSAVTIAALVELLVAHLLIHPWKPALAWTLTALSAFGALWLVGLMRAVVLRPILVEGDRLVVRNGIQWRVEIPAAQIERASTGRVTAPHRRARGHLQVSSIGQPNALLTLRTPATAIGAYGRTRRVETVALTLDEPQAFAQMLDRLGVASGVPR